jgi:hypothetical protein
MKRHLTPPVRFLCGRLRALWPDRNPLRRRWDRAEGAIVAGLLAAFLLGAPLTAHAAGQWARTTGFRALHSEKASSRRVPAVLLKNAGVAAVVGEELVLPQALVRWTAPDGTRRTGEVSVPAGMLAGEVTPVWITASGQLTNPPLRQRQVAGQASVAAVLAVFALGLALLGVGRVARLVLDRRRLAAWDADWKATGPRWTSIA